MQQNPFGIPDLTPMYEKVKEYVKKHQGEKGFILTDNSQYDTIWAIAFDEGHNTAWEPEVKAVRVDKHNNLQVIVDNSSIAYDDNAVMEAKGPEEADSYIGSWDDVQYSDYIYFIPTIFNIAESIREYVNEEE